MQCRQARCPQAPPRAASGLRASHELVLRKALSVRAASLRVRTHVCGRTRVTVGVHASLGLLFAVLFVRPHHFTCLLRYPGLLPFLPGSAQNQERPGLTLERVWVGDCQSRAGSQLGTALSHGVVTRSRDRVGCHS